MKPRHRTPEPLCQAARRGLSIVPPPDERPRGFVARQAIVDRLGRTWAYQLLYRDGMVAKARYADAHSATATVLMNTLMDMSLDTVVGDKVALIELSRQMLFENYSELLPKSRVMIQLPAEIEADAATKSILGQIRRLGYRVALGRFDPGSSAKELVKSCDYVKLDVSACASADLPACVEFVHKHGAKAIAHKVETKSQYQECRRLGFEHFQGFYLSDPRIFDHRRPPTDVQRVTELLRVLNDPASGVADIEQAVHGDVTLMYRLLRYLSSAAFGLRQQVSSVRQAIVLLGLENLKRWVLVLALANCNDKPAELLRIALIRARMCKNLTHYVGGNSDMFFIIGLFSVLDVLLDQPMSEILPTLPLAAEVSKAILKSEGPAGKALSCVVAYEKGHWMDVVLEGCEPAEIASAWFRAVEWTDKVMPAIA